MTNAEKISDANARLANCEKEMNRLTDELAIMNDKLSNGHVTVREVQSVQNQIDMKQIEIDYYTEKIEENES